MQIVGVDGCPGGWIAVVWETDTNTWEPREHKNFKEIVECYADAACIGIDIPIGLRDSVEARQCDIGARRLLGKPRGSSVFPAPQRSLLSCSSYPEANAQSKKCFNKGISQQAFGIFKKVFEVDSVMTPERQRQVIEVHPEVTFYAMNSNRPMTVSKKRTAGFAERQRLLATTLPLEVPATRAEARNLARFAGPDDLLDALAAAWTAGRDANGIACRIPREPEVDERGLRMEIVY